MDETDVADYAAQMLDAAEAWPARSIFVSNEVGMGMVPENAQARRYRDLVGRANQVIAALAARVTLVSCGIPLPLEEETLTMNLLETLPCRRICPARRRLSRGGPRSGWTNSSCPIGPWAD